jgi:TolA-binding protein
MPARPLHPPINPELLSGPRPAPPSLKEPRVSLALAFLSGLIFLLGFQIYAYGQGDGVPTLQNISLGQNQEYTRLVFTFDKAIPDVIVRRDDADSLLLDFGRAAANEETTIPNDGLVSGVSFRQMGERLVAQLALSTNRFESRHFLSRDQFSLVLDVKKAPPLPGTGEDDGDNAALSPTLNRAQLILEPPPLPGVIKSVALFIEPSSQAGAPERLVTDALELASRGRLDDAIVRLEKFKTDYPNHPYQDPALFLLGDLYFAKGLPENFLDATTNWRQAIDSFPQSFEGPRAAFMLGEANRLMSYFNEAAGLYKLGAESYQDSPWYPLCLIRAADMDLAMGLNQIARETVAPLIARTPSDPYSLLATLRVAMADYQDTLFSQSAEKFRDALDIDPQIYSFYPEMLYALGDSYSYLNRPDLTVLFLEHALNVIPTHPKADVMLARVGNALQAMGKPSEAISYFNLAKNLYPDHDGGLVSQIRLADMGALRAFFQGDQVFDALERGARQATARMYQRIIDSSSPSPLLQLAYLKLGQAQAADGENSQAIEWLRKLVADFPKGTLIDEAKPILSRAVVNEATERFDLGEYDKVDLLNQDNSPYLEGPDKLRFLRLLAQSYENMGRPQDALAVWRAIEKESPERRLADQKDLINAALAANNPDEAFSQIKATAREFPEENDWLYGKLYETALGYGNPQDEVAVENLLAFLNDPVVRPLEEIAKLALSEAISILVSLGNYDAASALMDSYRENYPADELSPEYLLTQSKMDRRQKRIESSWNRLSDFRVAYPEDERVPATIWETVQDARQRGLLPDAWRYEELYRLLYPNDPLGRSALLSRSEEQWNGGFPDEAMDSLNVFQREYPNDPGAPATYIDEYAKLLDVDRPLEAYQALREMRDRYPDDPLTMESYFTEYRDAIAAQTPDEAFRAFDEFRAKYPDDPRLSAFLLEKAKDYFAFDRVPEGLAAWADFLESYPEDPRAPELTLLMARQEYKDNRVPDALARYRSYLDGYPEDPARADVLLEIASLEGSAGMPEAAYADLETFRREFPNRPEEPQAILDEIGYATALGRIPEMTTLYDLFRSAYPNHPQVPDSFLSETRSLLAAGDGAQALSVLEDGVVRVPGIDDDSSVQDLLLSLYLDQGRVEDWAGATEEYLRRDPNPQTRLADRFQKYSQVAQVYQELGRQTDAQRNYDLAMSNKPPDASGEALYAIAGGYKKMGLDDSYRSVLEVMLSLPDPLWQRVASQELGQG